MIHISFSRNPDRILSGVISGLKAFELLPLEERSIDTWKQLCVEAYSAHYNFEEKSDDWYDKYRKVHDDLIRLAPPPLDVQRLTVLEKNGACMGEDVVLYAGRIQHPIHHACEKCHCYSLVSGHQGIECYNCGS